MSFVLLRTRPNTKRSHWLGHFHFVRGLCLLTACCMRSADCDFLQLLLIHGSLHNGQPVCKLAVSSPTTYVPVYIYTQHTDLLEHVASMWLKLKFYTP